MLTVARNRDEILASASGEEEVALSATGISPEKDRTSKRLEMVGWVGEVKFQEAFLVPRTITSVYSGRPLSVELKAERAQVTGSQCSVSWTEALSDAMNRDCSWATSRAEVSRSDLKHNSVDSLRTSSLRLAIILFAVVSL